MFQTSKTMPTLLVLLVWGVAFGLYFVTSSDPSITSRLGIGPVLLVFMGIVFASAKFAVEGDTVITKVLWARHVVPIAEINDMKVVDGFWRRQFGLAGVAFRRDGRFNIFSNAKDAQGLANAIQASGAY